MTLSDLARLLGVSKSTAYAILQTLLAGGFVADSGAGMSRRYRLGMALARLGDVVVSQIALRDVAMPVMRDLTRETGLTSRVAVLDEPYAVVIARVDAPHSTVRFTAEPRQARAPALLGRRQGDARRAAGDDGARDPRSGRAAARRRRTRSPTPDALLAELESVVAARLRDRRRRGRRGRLLRRLGDLRPLGALRRRDQRHRPEARPAGLACRTARAAPCATTQHGSPRCSALRREPRRRCDRRALVVERARARSRWSSARSSRPVPARSSSGPRTAVSAAPISSCSRGEVDPAFVRYPLTLGHEWSGVSRRSARASPASSPASAASPRGSSRAGTCATLPRGRNQRVRDLRRGRLHARRRGGRPDPRAGSRRARARRVGAAARRRASSSRRPSS